MGMFKRIKQIAAADLHGVLDRFEDPVAMVKQYIREIEEEMENAREAMARQLAAEQNYGLLIVQTRDTIAKRSRQAELAVDKEDDAIAELALEDKLQQSRLLAGYEEQQAAVRDRLEALKTELTRLAQLHRELTTKLEALLIRAHAAQAVGAAASAAPSFRTDEIVRNVSRMEAKVWRMEAGANASRQLSAALDPLKQWERRDEVRAELERLKAAKNK
ncbi:PspA/IM30 family protein [Paenibacillus sp.]|uniref:PspA/IM30 family protein n=1 Tax=Paenibacillus sp. TaxID=58172 RepID=UPI002812512D|nr:PspA/IM30 family protein [Paenibacillus sp.]